MAVGLEGRPRRAAGRGAGEVRGSRARRPDASSTWSAGSACASRRPIFAVAAALASAVSGRTLPADAVFFGEIGLLGEVRPVSQAEVRLREAAALDFRRAFLPAAPRRHGRPGACSRWRSTTGSSCSRAFSPEGGEADLGGGSCAAVDEIPLQAFDELSPAQAHESGRRPTPRRRRPRRPRGGRGP